MLKKLFVALIVCMVLYPCFSYATEESVQTDSLKPQSVEELHKSVEISKALKEAIDVTSTDNSTTDTQVSQNNSTHQVSKDVLYKGLNLLERYVLVLSSVINDTSSNVWTILVRQQYVDAISGIIQSWVLVFMTLAFHLIVSKVWPDPLVQKINTHKIEESEDQREKKAKEKENAAFIRICVAFLLPALLGISFTICALWRTGTLMPILFNPEYYAIKNLLELIITH